MTDFQMHISKTKDWLTISSALLFLLAGWLLRAAITIVILTGFAVSAFPGVTDKISSSGWPPPEELFSWAASVYIPLALFVLLFQMWRISKSISNIEDKVSAHDIILGGLMNYLDVVPKYPDQDRILNMSDADKLRESIRNSFIEIIPIFGSLAKRAYKYDVYNTKLCRAQKEVTLQEDLHKNRGGCGLTTITGHQSMRFSPYVSPLGGKVL